MSRTGKKIFWGIYFLLAAAFLIVSQLGFFPGTGFWQIVGGILLVTILVDSIVKVFFPGMLFSVAFFIILFDEQLGLTAITPWYVLGAALLGSIGLCVLFPKSGRRYFFWDKSPVTEHIFSSDVNEQSVNGSKVMFKTNFGEGIKYINSEDFRMAELTTSFGEMKVYFDNAHIMPDVIPEIYVDTSFGELTLFIPREWQIINKVSAGFGNVDEHRCPDNTVKQYTVNLTGKVGFGNVSIVYI